MSSITTEDSFERQRQESWNEALNTFGTAYIFEKRALRLARYLRILHFLGIAVPATVGSAAISFGTDSSLLPFLGVLAGVLTVMQLVWSVWAMVARWTDGLAYAVESRAANERLSKSFASLGRNPPGDIFTQFELLEAENRSRRNFDHKQGITDREKRMAMRAALREFQRPCVTCRKIPSTMEPDSCPVCGNF